MREFVEVAGTMGDESRVRALMALRGGELCLCQLIELLELAPSTVSKHMSILHRAGLVESRKEGRWTHYRLPGKEASPCVVEALNWVRRALEQDEQVAADVKSLRKVQKRKKEEVSACCYRG